MARKPRHLRIKEFVRPPSLYHIARRTRPGSHRLAQHTHDFPELFWLERGSTMHVVNGRRQRLEAGDLVLIRPADCHGYAPDTAPPREHTPSRDTEPASSTAPPTGFTFVNIAFHQPTLDHIEDRYFREHRLPWHGDADDDALPAVFRLSPAQRRRLSALAEGLSATAHSRLQFEGFLLTMLQMVADHTRDAGLVSAAAGDGPSLEAPPQWLREAISRFDDPAYLTGGPAEFARLAGYCPEHVNRVVRRCFGKRTTDLINDLRLDHAARRLRMTDDAITDIAGDCGLNHLGHFYKLFNARFDATPKAYRRSERHPV